MTEKLFIGMLIKHAIQSSLHLCLISSDTEANGFRAFFRLGQRVDILEGID
jgi:hypothetical protein